MLRSRVPASPSAPGDLTAGFELPTGKVPVRVQLMTSDGHTLDKTMTVAEQLTRPFGSGCAGRYEIDLAVTKDGALVPGGAAPVA